MYIHRFLNLPFLALQRAGLVSLLAQNSSAFASVQSDLQLAEEREDATCTYEKWVTFHYQINWYSSKVDLITLFHVNEEVDFQQFGFNGSVVRFVSVVRLALV